VPQCIEDNKDEDANPDVIKKYCECMSRKMDPSESQPISEWETSHPEETKACDKEAGWK